MQETIEGIIESFSFRNTDTGFTVFKIRVEGVDGTSKLVAQSDAMPGQKFTATGEWVKDTYVSEWSKEENPVQFKAATVVASMPVTKSGLVKYMSSGIIKGVGEKVAGRIVEKFGLDAIDIIENSPEKLKGLSGVGAKTIEKIKTGWSENQATNRIMLFLQSNGIPTGQAQRIYRAYGRDAVEKIVENPYKLANDIRGIGFKNADKIAMNLGVPKESMQRARAAISYIVNEHSTKGHCGMPFNELVKVTSGTLEITVGLVEEAIKEELAVFEDPVIISIDDGDGEVIYLKRLANYEEKIADKLKSLVKLTPPWEIPNSVELERIINHAEKQAGITLADQQREAVRTGLTKRVMVLTGGPGTGKTSILKCLLAAYRHIGVRYTLAAPTGKAARRMKESTGSAASTLHRLFRLGQDEDTTDVGLVTDVIVIDESSMIDVTLNHAVLDGLPEHASLVIVGDIDQLPSVGPGSILGDMISSGVIPTVRLTQIFRQAQGSMIIRNAHLVNHGEMPVKGGQEGDFFFVPISERDILAKPGRDPDVPVEPEEIAQFTTEMVVDLVNRRLPAKYDFDPKKDIQVLAPMNGGLAGTQNMNIMIQKAVNPPTGDCAERMGVKFGVGDRVMQIVNNYEKMVYNGDTGVIFMVDKEDKKIVVKFDSHNVDYEFHEIDELVLAYAMTIHKSQGSQFPAVIIPILNQHYMMLARNLLYTGITRASKLVILVGQESAVRRAVQNDKTTKRVTRLKTLLTK